MKRILTVCAMLCLPFSSLAAEGYAMVFKTQGEFQYVRDAVEMAIQQFHLVFWC